MIGVIDGMKFESLEHNRNYNRHHSTVNRNLVLTQDPRKKLVNAGVNLPGNFHDSFVVLFLTSIVIRVFYPEFDPGMIIYGRNV